jgi:hypothetical protein
VTLLLAGFGFPMTETAVGSGTWTVAVPVADAAAGPVSIQATCPGVTYVLTLGQLVFYEPLGTVTDAGTGDPIEGAEVTLYRVPGWTAMAGPEDTGPTKCQSNESQSGAPWSQPAPTGEGVEEPALSDAMAPSVNPFLSNAGGRYGWSLTEGCWYVVVEADGYEPLTSPVVGIGSPIVDLDLELVAVDEPPSFPDVPESHQFWADIIWMAERGITTGYPDGYFRPGWGVTRGSMAAFMARLDDVLGSDAGGRTPCPGAGPFPDVGTTHPFCAEITWMVGEGITTGFPDGTYRPGDGVTRQSMAAFMYRMAGSPDGLDPVCSVAPLPDVPTSNPMCGEIAWMLDEEITGGYPDGTYRPGVAVSRQAMSAFMHRFADVLD